MVAFLWVSTLALVPTASLLASPAWQRQLASHHARLPAVMALSDDSAALEGKVAALAEPSTDLEAQQRQVTLTLTLTLTLT